MDEAQMSKTTSPFRIVRFVSDRTRRRHSSRFVLNH